MPSVDQADRPAAAQAPQLVAPDQWSGWSLRLQRGV